MSWTCSFEYMPKLGNEVYRTFEVDQSSSDELSPVLILAPMFTNSGRKPRLASTLESGSCKWCPSSHCDPLIADHPEPAGLLEEASAPVSGKIHGIGAFLVWSSLGYATHPFEPGGLRILADHRK